ncbi:MAG: MmgE/PrpD family protein [Ferrimicrobium sp.]
MDVASDVDLDQAKALLTGKSVSKRLADFACGLRFEDIPSEVVAHAKRCLLDSVGVAFASGTYDFARRALSALSMDSSDGRFPVIGFADRLSRRDSAVFNGVLIHGLDYDDTHVPGVVHASASSLATALAVGTDRRLAGREFLTGYILGLEVTSRLSAVAGGEFHQVGFHPTGLLGAFGAATLAGRLSGLSAEAISQAQGIVGSMASGSLEFLESGAWTKRLHPGWAAASGLISASLASQGFVGPEQIYEGRFGLYRSHLGQAWSGDPEIALRGLGEEWETARIALKPFAACHFTHAFADAAIALHHEGLRADDVRSIECLIAAGEVGTVCEPAEAKRQPKTDYEAKFSLPYVVAASLMKGKLSLMEFGADTLFDPRVADLAGRVSYRSDPTSGFPVHYSGELVVNTVDGRVLRKREQINRGAEERPLDDAAVAEKFCDNVMMSHSASFAEQLIGLLTSVESVPNVAELAEALRG